MSRSDSSAADEAGSSPCEVAAGDVADPGPGCWPGLAPLGCDDAERFFGRERELERLVRLYKRPKSGQTPVVWLWGDAGSGKTSLVMAGLLPRLREDFGNENFEWVRIVPARGSGARRTVEAIAGAVLDRAGPETEGGGLDPEGRLRQFRLLMDQDSAEAVDYLAACYRRNVETGDGRSGSTCFIFLDELDRIPSSGDLLPSDETWLNEHLAPLLDFLRELSFAGCFPCLAAVRALNFPAVKAAAAGGGGIFGTEVPLAPIPADAVRRFFESAPSPTGPTGRVEVDGRLLDSLLDQGGGEDRGSGRLPFVSETLKRLSGSDPLMETIRSEDIRWAGGVRKTWAEVAESVVSWLPGKDVRFFELMAALHPPAIYTDNGREILSSRPVSAPYLSLAGDAELQSLTDGLVDARVLSLSGSAPEQAEVSWSIPDAILKWDRAFRWLEKNDRLLSRAEVLDRAREVWESERRTPVKLLHATRAIADAEKLLKYHRRRAILSAELAAYLEESIDFDERLGSDWRRRRWIRFGLIAGGIGLTIAGVVFLVLTAA